ncbi:MAG: hypothetical protein ACTSRS_03775 [Candidatus Helarchaeota archaeon]
MSTRSENEILADIEKNRYLISCKCKICNKNFKDIILGSQHVYNDHPKRAVRNVIDNLTWDYNNDLRQWTKLQALKAKRDMIITKLTDEYAISEAKIPEIIEIARRNVNITGLIETLLKEMIQKEESSKKKEEDEEIEIEEDIDERDFEITDEDEESNTIEEAVNDDEELEKIINDDEELEENNEEDNGISPPSTTKNKVEVITNKSEIPKLIELLERELEKYIRRIRRISMAEDVKKALEGKKKKRPNLYKLADQLNYYLGISKAIQILKSSS